MHFASYRVCIKILSQAELQSTPTLMNRYWYFFPNFFLIPLPLLRFLLLSFLTKAWKERPGEGERKNKKCGFSFWFFWLLKVLALRRACMKTSRHICTYMFIPAHKMCNQSSKSKKKTFYTSKHLCKSIQHPKVFIFSSRLSFLLLASLTLFSFLFLLHTSELSGFLYFSHITPLFHITAW